MSKTIKIGGVDVNVPDDSPLAPIAGRADGTPEPLRAEKPEEPEKFESLPWVYRPNDLFQGPIDRVVALGNVHSSGKPWIRKSFVILFFAFPIGLLGISALDALFSLPPPLNIRRFVQLIGAALLSILPAVMIWKGSLNLARSAPQRPTTGAKPPRPPA